MKKLKVLVFDDSEIHRKSARLLLGTDYDLIVVGTYDEAQEALIEKIDYDKMKSVFFDKFGDSEPYKSGIDDDLRRERIAFYHGEAQEKSTTYPDFDIVLTDLFVPASRQAQGDKGLRFVGQEMPLGTTIALLAICAGVKKVAVVTDTNHHHHPASAVFDCFRNCRAKGVDVICTNNVNYVDIDEATGKLISNDFIVYTEHGHKVYTEEGEKKYPYSQISSRGERDGILWGKDWKTVLLMFVSEPEQK